MALLPARAQGRVPAWEPAGWKCSEAAPVGAIRRNCMNREGLGGHPDQDTSRAERKSGAGAGRGTGKNSATEAKGAVRPKDRLRQVRSCRMAQSRRAGGMSPCPLQGQLGFEPGSVGPRPRASHWPSHTASQPHGSTNSPLVGHRQAGWSCTVTGSG